MDEKTFDKEYFEGKQSNYNLSSKEMMMKNVYFPWAIIKEDVKPSYRILDIGCAYGHFLKYCDKYGLETFGIDISEYAINEAQKITNAKLLKHDINNGLSIFEDDSFDMITIFDVIEHLQSPYNSLKEIKRILNRNGKLIMTTCNLRAIDAIIKGKNWHGFQDDTHIYLFTPTSLKYLVNRVGLDVIKLSTPFHPFPKLIQKVANKTGLGGQIWLVAKKI